MSARILHGGPDSSGVSHESFGKLLHDAIRRAPSNRTVLIDALTRSEMTYGEVFVTTRSLACGLAEFGVGKGDVVALINDNTVRYGIPVLATLYLGATINPLNPMYSKRELLAALETSGATFIICSECVLKTVLSLKMDSLPAVRKIIVDGQGVAGETVDLDHVIDMGRDSANNFTVIPVDPKIDVAAILCSSGTTGLPKGVMLTHENLRVGMTYLSHERIQCIIQDDMLVGVAPCFHIFGLLVLLTSLFSRARLIIVEKFKPDAFLALLQDYRATRLVIVPSLAVFLAKSPLVANYDVSSIIDIVCGAAALGKDVQHLLEERFNARLRQCYGMTEATGGITFCRYGETGPNNSVGTVLPELALRVMNVQTGEMLGPGEPGELRFKGPMIMKGYKNNVEAMKIAFDQDGWLCSGDIGYYDEDGHVYIVERLKELIKYKGFQVPPAELEDILLSHAEVKDAGVIGVPDERSGELPLAFVVKQPGARVSEQQLIDFVANSVSVQKRLYGGVRFVEEIPKNPSGKILRRVLRAMV